LAIEFEPAFGRCRVQTRVPGNFLQCFHPHEWWLSTRKNSLAIPDIALKRLAAGASGIAATGPMRPSDSTRSKGAAYLHRLFRADLHPTVKEVTNLVKAFTAVLRHKMPRYRGLNETPTFRSRL